MFEEFKKIMKEIYEVDNVELESNFKTDFGLTSFDVVRLICVIEEKYGVELDEEKYRSLNTVQELITYLESLK